MQSIVLNKTHKIMLAAVSFLVFFVISSNKAHAATIDVAGGCTLPIAINSINAGSNQSGCTATGAYGTNDTINLPAGIITLTASLPTITESVVVQGAGMSSTIIDGNNGLYETLSFEGEGATFGVHDLKVLNFRNIGIQTMEGDVDLSNIEIDGTNAIENSNFMSGIAFSSQEDTAINITTNNIYIHDLSADAENVVAFFIARYGGNSSTTADFQNTTVANITNTDAEAIAFYMLTNGNSTIDYTATNTTIDNIVANGAALGFGGLAMAFDDDSTVSGVVNFATITGLHGSAGSLGQSVAFFTGGAADTGVTSTTTIDAQNVLLADNISDSTSSNCGELNLNDDFSLTGPVVSAINSLGYNISDDDSCADFNQTGDQQNVANIIDTLGPLQNNGGSVPTRALLPGSPAINAGGAVLGVTTDARGVARPSSSPSVGAYQFEGAAAPGEEDDEESALAETGSNAVLVVLSGFLLVALAVVVRRKATT